MTELLPLTPDELLTTTRAVRRRLDLSRPVPLAVIREALEVALQAPSGGNRQRWHWIVLTDPDLKAQVADYYRRSHLAYRQVLAEPADPAAARIATSHHPGDEERHQDGEEHPHHRTQCRLTPAELDLPCLQRCPAGGGQEHPAPPASRRDVRRTARPAPGWRRTACTTPAGGS